MIEDKPTSIVIFGASGDLTRRKLIPGLFSLYKKNRLPTTWQVFGFAMSEWTDEQFRENVRAGIVEFYKEPFADDDWTTFAANLYYVPGKFGVDADFERLETVLRSTGSPNRLYYLATSPRFFSDIIHTMGRANMTDESSGWRRCVIEKPFGRDLESAEALNESIHEVLNETQIFRIDHYLAKETVQNLLVFRFGNIMFEPIWNRNYIDMVQITAAESVDVGHRAGYYDKAGVLRDMFQNHLLQLMSLVAMEPPASFEADAIRNEKVKVLASVKRITDSDVAFHTVRGQYQGYLDAPDVAEHSQTATYAAIRLFIENWRWKGVPFVLRSGKALKEKCTEINIRFKKLPHLMFPLPEGKEITPNVLAIDIQPNEAIRLRFEAKVPDTDAEMRSVNMEFEYGDFFGEIAVPEAYERLLLEALEGDASLFTRADGIVNAWQLIDPIMKGWESSNAPELVRYDKGSWGPEDAVGGSHGGRFPWT